MTIEQEKKLSKGERSLASSLYGLKEEIGRVSWPSKEELRKGAKLVVGATFLCGFAIYLADLAIRGVLGVVRALFHWVFG